MHIIYLLNTPKVPTTHVVNHTVCFFCPEEKVSFTRMSDVSVRECHRLLSRYIPSNARVNKLYQMLFVKYGDTQCNQSCMNLLHSIQTGTWQEDVDFLRNVLLTTTILMKWMRKVWLFICLECVCMR